MRDRARWRSSMAAMLYLACGGPARADEPVVLLEVLLNGRDTANVGEFTRRDNQLYATPQELTELGFKVPEALAHSTDPIPLTAIPGLHAEVNERKGIVDFTVPNSALRPARIDVRGGPESGPITEPPWGGLVNYDVLGTFGGQGTGGGAFGEARLFGPYGVLSSTGIALFSPTVNQQQFTRLDTNWTYSEPDNIRQWRAGDLITSAVGWSRPVRIGGAQVNTNFELRPDLITYPIPLVSSSVTVPSTVDVMINNVRQFSQPVQPGPFELRNLPMTSGSGQVVLQTTDALGQQTLLTVPFYVTPQLLAVGLSSYSVEAGPVRQNYDQLGDGYSNWAASGSLRRGVTDWLTLETHAESTSQLMTAGVGVATRVGHLGTASVAVAGSSGRGSPTPVPAAVKTGASGGLISASVERSTSKYSLGFSLNLASAGYRDVAATLGTPVPTTQARASVSMPLGDFARYGTAAVSYLEQRVRATSQIADIYSSPAFGYHPVDYSGSSYSMLMANYSLSFQERYTFYAVGYKDIGRAHTAGILFGISVYLGDFTQAGASAGSDSGRSNYTASIQRNSSNTQDYSYSVMDREGFQPRRTATADYRDKRADLTVGIDQTAGTIYKRAGVSGSIVLMDGSLKMSDQIDNSFAVVKTGTTGQIPVYFENRYAGATDSDGSLLLPDLRSYQRNQISIDVKELPPDVQVGATRKVVRPPDRSGVVVEFNVKASGAAVLKLVDSAGAAIPIGSVVRVEGSEPAPVGYGGEAFVTDLHPSNRTVVTLPNGKECTLKFDFVPAPGEIPLIGPLKCE